MNNQCTNSQYLLYENTLEPHAWIFCSKQDLFVSEALGKQGSYKLDAARSAIAIDATKAFPKNTEVEAILTFTSVRPCADRLSVT